MYPKFALQVGGFLIVLITVSTLIENIFISVILYEILFYYFFE